MQSQIKNLIKPLKTALIMLVITTGCREEGTDNVKLYTYTDVKFVFNATAKDSSSLPVVSLKNMSMKFSLAEFELGDTMIHFNRKKGFSCTKELISLSRILKDPLDRIDLIADRSFGPNHPAGVSLNSFLFFTYGINELPKPLENWNALQDNYKNTPTVLGIDFPDTVKGKTLFVCMIRRKSGQTLVDSSYVILQ